MGVLYESLDMETGSRIALKVLHRDLLSAVGTDNFIARFQREALLTAGLKHPGIVSVYEHGEESGCAYIAMEYLQGSDLRDCFENEVGFSIRDSVEILSQLLRALQYAHEQGVWHGDIKPSNVLISNSGQVKIADFGIARAASTWMDEPDDVMGTPGYVAPETYLSDAVDHRIDVFAAGAVLYRLLTGVPPFEGTAQQIMLQACYEKPLPPSMASGQPALRPYDGVVLRALAKRPQERYSSAAEFHEALMEAHTVHPGRFQAKDNWTASAPQR